MAFTKEQRLLVLMAIACMGLAVVSAGCLENAGASRDILKNKTLTWVNAWCLCADLGRANGESDVVTIVTNCFKSFNFYNQSKDFVNCANETEFKTLINPEELCESFKKIDPPVTTKPPTPTPTPTTVPTEPPTPTPTPTNAPTTSSTSVTTKLPSTPDTASSTPVSTTKPTSSTTQNPITTTTSEPETGPTHLYWLIPLILVLVAAMFGLGCYLHRRTKGSRGFHHSTKTNGSTKATNGEA